MINVLAYKIRNRFYRYKVLRDPLIKMEEAWHTFSFGLQSERRKALEQRYLQCAAFDDLFKFACEVLGPHQKKVEIEGFLKFASTRQPKTALEIGMAQAGNTFLLKEYLKTLTKLVGVDIYLHNTYVLKALNKRACSLSFFEGDSGASQVKAQVENALAGNKLDLLFIDGDHSYEGVKADFQNYSPLVANGGMIVFHDICEDYKTRFGKHTGTYTGGVPQFWKEVKQGFESHEFVEDYDQDGFGIGCIIYKGAN